jgi:4-alpha-glucanotransferase
MDADTVIRSLAVAHGIQLSWRDVWGQERAVGIDTLRALLGALNVGIDSPASVRESLNGAGRLDWPSEIPAIVTAEAGSRIEIQLMRPAAEAEGEVAWAILMGGIMHDGRAACRRVSADDGGMARFAVAIDMPGLVGIGRISLQGGAWGEGQIVIAPPHCFAIDASRRLWGIATQIYGLRQPGDGGVGHHAALAALAESAGRQGASALGISPTHALFAADPGHFSPYAPSDRRFHNGLLSDPHWIPGAAALDAGPLHDALARIEAANAEALIDYPKAMQVRRQSLRAVFDTFAVRHLGESLDELGRSFLSFRAGAGMALWRHAVFEALQAHFFGGDPGLWQWQSWPAPYQDPASASVAAFAAANAATIEFHCFLQWLATRQLDAVQRKAVAAGMPIGIIADLAVGTHSSGSRAWADRGALLNGASIGAPPDLLAPAGQDWGLTTFSPTGLKAAAYAPFREDLNAAMRFAGGIRLDHVMGLTRLWCIPRGASPDQGAYLRMPWDDLKRLVALHSQERRCIVVGEDLGTVPEGFREELQRQRILGISVLWFERDGAGNFHRPERYSPFSLATTSTHDLPTVVGWWLGRDIDWRVRLGQIGTEQEGELRSEREQARAALWRALHERGFVADALVPHVLDAPAVAAIVGFIAATPSPVVLLPLEDALLQDEQPNLPGTTVEHPNWRRRFEQAATQLLDQPATRQILDVLRAQRPDRSPV